MSVNNTVPNERVVARSGRTPMANSMNRSVISRQLGRIHEKWSSPSIS
ncbi:MAG: hypothetical protein GY946_33480 [bacterium]|nr:hypothetical protein [bacterium]